MAYDQEYEKEKMEAIRNALTKCEIKKETVKLVWSIIGVLACFVVGIPLGYRMSVTSDFTCEIGYLVLGLLWMITVLSFSYVIAHHNND